MTVSIILIRARMNIPAEHGGVGFGLLPKRHGADIQRGQVHPQQLRDPLSAVDVAIFVEDLQVGADVETTFTLSPSYNNMADKNSPFS